MATTSSGGAVAGAIAEKKPKEAPPVRAALNAVREQLAQVLDGRITPDKQIQLVAVMAYSSPNLAKCDKASLQMAVIRASSYGLSLDPAAQEAFLIPRWDRKANGYLCHFQMGYQGVRKLLLRSGEVAAVETALVYERDAFRFRRTDAGLDFCHEPDCFAADRGAIRGVYSYATLRTGTRLVETMSVAEVNVLRDAALLAMTRKGDDGKPWRPESPWDTHWGEMARKTVLKRHGKSLPRPDEYDRAVRDDDAISDRIVGRVVAAIGGEGSRPPAPGRGLAGLSRQIEARAADPEPSFSVDAGVAQPLRSEAGDDDYPAAYQGDDDDQDQSRGREPGDD